ncbi:hypothetical protein FE257_003452 [Aspergillus nanangensis]|uniref:Ser-Thr-rich glycosyl-phosphatidyl-inositol-anchored membrane family-domain-containing protein n=1 Tax=Aspergillus nanangensis TaxID=2582783 RepID=A0AAD4GMU3_ASPNN|nr:hypothetical protein FE257_003452 [Aspergillus nanangensis]
MRFVRSLPYIGSFLPLVLADVDFVAPSADTVVKAGDVVTAQWKDSGRLPHISQLSQYNLYLCAQTNIDGSDEFTALVEGISFARGNSVSFQIDPQMGSEEPQTYFLKMVSSGPEDPVINYSDRFTLIGLTGDFSPGEEDHIRSVREGYERTDLRKRQAEGAYTIPYNLQVGPTRYAPMAKRPGSTIPPKSVSPTPQNPASAYDIATAYLPQGTVQTTKSASLTYSEVSVENTASPAPNPQDAQMKRLLERWKD